MDLLLRKGADVNERSYVGEAPLLIAINGKYESYIRVLKILVPNASI